MLQVNRTFRNLSRSFKSYWIAAVLRAGLTLPLSPNHPLNSFTASELHLAVHKAVFRERNLRSPKPRLYSHTLITWPFCPPRMMIKESDSRRPTVEVQERSYDAVWMTLQDETGEWLFVVSRDAVIRVLHLRTGILACEKQFCQIVVPTSSNEHRVRFATDFKGDGTATMALVVNEIRKGDYYPESKEEESEDGDGERWGERWVHCPFIVVIQSC